MEIIGTLLAAFLGALVGWAAPWWQQRQKDKDALTAKQVAVRLWRDDFYQAQDVLSGYVERGRLPHTPWHPTATDDDFRLLAGAIGQGEDWTVISRSRRKVLDLRARLEADRDLNPPTVRRVFHELNEARRVLAKLDPADWNTYKPHRATDRVPRE